MSDCVDTAILQRHTLDDILDIVCQEVQQISGAEGARIWLLEDDGWLRLLRQRGAVIRDLEGLPLAGSFSALAVQQKKALLTNDPANTPQLIQRYPELTSLLVLPLILDDKVIGLLHALNKPGGFTADDMRILSLVANQAALAIENERLHEQVKEAAVLEERTHLARELHDSVTQALYSVMLYADATRLALAAGRQTVATENLQELRKMARQAMADMRLLLFQLHPPRLEKEGLATALRTRLDAVETRAGLQIDYEVEGERRLSLAVEEELYHIAQEALNNVIKHARAEQVTVHLHFADHHCTLTIQDDGVGFDPATAHSSGGFGLRGMAERAQQIGGAFELASAPGQGTTVHIEVSA